MRVALISMAGQPRDAARNAPLALAGKTLARRQLDFALAAGCESVIALGDGASAEAIALRHAAEAGGAKFQVIRDSHGLLGAVRAADDLLALAPGLLPEAQEAIAALEKGPAVLVLRAGQGVAAGFERIDLERAWAGALVLSGGQVERLSTLPADSEPASALVRIALQARAPEKSLPEAALADGLWTIVPEDGDVAFREASWLKRHMPAASALSPTKWLARQALRPLASSLLAAGRSFEALVAVSLAVLAGAVLAAWYELAPLGFVLVPFGAILAYMALDLVGLTRAPFGRSERRMSVAALLPCVVDAAIVACAVLAIEGAWLHRLFPPLVLLGSLLALRASEAEWTSLPRDRGILGAILAVAAGLGAVEPVIMLVSLALIALNIAQSRAKRG